MAFLKFVVAIASLVVLAPGAGANETTDSDRLPKLREALEVVNDFADKMCATIPLEGKGGTIQLSGDAQAQLAGLLDRLVKLGIDGAVKFKQDQYQGLLQGDLVTALKESTTCKLHIWNDLKDKLLPPENGQHRASVMDLTVFSQRSVVSENGQESNTVVFRIENKLELNIGRATIEIFPESGPLPHRYDGSFFAHTAKCVTTSRWNDAIWKISCEYIGAGGIVGFAVDSDGEDGFPSGTLVISSSEATKSHRF